MKTKICPDCKSTANPCLYLFFPGWICSDENCRVCWGSAAIAADLLGFLVPGLLEFRLIDEPKQISYYQMITTWWKTPGDNSQ